MNHTGWSSKAGGCAAILPLALALATSMAVSLNCQPVTRLPSDGPPPTAAKEQPSSQHAAAPAMGKVNGHIRDSAGEPLEGSRVHFHTSESSGGAPDFRSAPSAADGSYEAHLPVGRYWIVVAEAGTGPEGAEPEKPGPESTGSRLTHPGGALDVDGDTVFDLVVTRSTGVAPVGPRIDGVVVSEAGPLANPTVHAYASFSDYLAKRPAAIALPGDAPGYYRLSLAPGKYYLAARASDGGQSYLAYLGANPITVESDLWLPLMAVRDRPAKSDAAQRSRSRGPRLRGVVSYKGQPVAAAQVSLYAKGEGPFKGLGVLSTRTRTDGSFTLSPQEGSYLVIARKRRGARRIRPLVKGDLFCFSPSNPVLARTGTEVEIELPCYPKQDVHSFIDPSTVALVKRPDGGGVRLRDATSSAHVGGELRGRVVDTEGHPVSGLFVMLYARKPRELFQMHMLRDKPAHLTKTEDDGHYRVKVASVGAYTLVARARPGGAPEPGEHFGLYEGRADHAVDVRRSGSQADDLVVSRLMHGDKTAAPAGARMAASGPLGDIVIADDTSWTGDITIEGVVVVARRATLTIEAGTTIRFARNDRNGDSIGDGELRVLGKLVVRGRADAPVTFTSLEDKPQAGDWAYVLLFTAREESVIEHARFEHAYTGLQAHFSWATVRDSVFQHNVEGLRFGRAKMTIEHNDIRANKHGIRHHRIEDPIRIVANDIVDNEVGIFLVPSGQNTIGFSAERYSISDDRRKQPLVKGNNIANNSKYNYRLGDRFGYDIAATGNWWGTVSPEAIDASIFDGDDDSSLGHVVHRPFRTAPAPGAGRRAP